MEEERIRNRRPVFPWVILGVVVLGVIAYFLFSKRQAGLADDIGIDAPYMTEAGTPAEVGAYIALVNSSDTTSMSVDHEYSSNALIQLIQAVRAKANQLGTDMQPDLDRAVELSNAIKKDPQATTHANNIRTAAKIIVTALQHLQQNHYANLDNEMNAVSKAAEGINPDKLALEQKSEIQSFFSEAANLLDKMK